MKRFIITMLLVVSLVAIFTSCGSFECEFCGNGDPRVEVVVKITDSRSIKMCGDCYEVQGDFSPKKSFTCTICGEEKTNLWEESYMGYEGETVEQNGVTYGICEDCGAELEALMNK